MSDWIPFKAYYVFTLDKLITALVKQVGFRFILQLLGELMSRVAGANNTVRLQMSRIPFFDPKRTELRRDE